MKEKNKRLFSLEDYGNDPLKVADVFLDPADL